MEVKTIHIANSWEYPILKCFNNILEVFTSEFLMAKDFPAWIRRNSINVQKITYDSSIYKFRESELKEIIELFSKLGYKMVYANKSLSHVEFQLSNSGTI